MKKILLVLVVLGAIASVAGCILGVSATYAFASNTLKGSGRPAARRIEAPAFVAVDASRAVKVRLVDGPDSGILVVADDNLIDLVKVEAVRGRLKVGFDRSVKNISNANVWVNVPVREDLRSLDASSAARIVCDGTIEAKEISLSASSAGRISVAAVKADKCELDASSASRITAGLDVRECEVDLSSAAKIELTGSAGRCRADLSSASKLSAEELVAVACEVDASSAAKAVVNCSGKLDAEASSGSSIRYRGDCSVRLSKSSGGSIRRE